MTYNEEKYINCVEYLIGLQDRFAATSRPLKPTTPDRRVQVVSAIWGLEADKLAELLESNDSWPLAIDIVGD